MTVDKAVTEAAAGARLGRAMATGLRDMLMRPHVVVRSPAYWLVMGVYASTYGANNLIDVLAERRDMSSAAHKSSKLVVATGAYTASSIFKDVAFAKMFSKAADAAKPVQRAVPMATYGTFLFRDSLIIGAGFILPAMVAGVLRTSTDMEQKGGDGGAARHPVRHAGGHHAYPPARPELLQRALRHARAASARRVEHVPGVYRSAYAPFLLGLRRGRVGEQGALAARAGLDGKQVRRSDTRCTRPFARLSAVSLYF
jgi:hypothetical protein